MGVLANSNRDGSAIDESRVITAKEQDDSRNVLWRRPRGVVGIWHGSAVRRSVDDARQNRVGANTGTLQIGGGRIHHGDGRGFRGNILGRRSHVLDRGNRGNVDDGAVTLRKQRGHHIAQQKVTGAQVQCEHLV